MPLQPSRNHKISTGAKGTGLALAGVGFGVGCGAPAAPTAAWLKGLGFRVQGLGKGVMDVFGVE